MQVYGYCIFKNGEQAKLIYPKEGFEDDVSGRSFTHGRFAQRLRHAAASAPNVTVRQGTVRRLLNGKQLLCAKESSHKPGPACLACWVCDNTARRPLKSDILTLYFIETSKIDTSAQELLSKPVCSQCVTHDTTIELCLPEQSPATQTSITGTQKKQYNTMPCVACTVY